MPAAPSPRPDPTAPDPAAPHPVDGSADDRPNRAMRRGKRTGAAPAVLLPHARGAAPHARGAQGRRIIPVRRTG
jgi:hypothetical protein